MRITSGGNVGIGVTSNLSARLTVNGGLSIGNGWGSSGATLEMSTDNVGSGGAAIEVSYWGTSSYGPLMFRTGGSEKMRITGGGLVGIGTSDPKRALHISGTGANAEFELTNTAMASGSRNFNIWGYPANGTWNIRTLTDDSGGQSVNFVSFLASTGAATFSSSVTASTGYYLKHSNGTTIAAIEQFSGTQGAGLSLFNSSGTQNVLFNAGGDSFIRGGNVGIGTTAPSDKLTVEGNISIGSTYKIYNGSAADSAGLYFSSNQVNISGFSGIIFRSSATNVFDQTERMRITSSGDVLVNATSTTQGAKFYVNGIGAFGQLYAGNLGTGALYSNAGFLTNTNPSDYRLKNTIKPLTYGLNEVLQLNPKTFYYNDDVTKARLKYGFIAQEVKDVMPDLVRRLGADTDYLGLENEGIFVTLVNAIKEQQVQLNEQRSIINELKSQLNK